MCKARLEVICGPMFAGKTEELIRRVKRATFAKQKILVYKPLIDNRYGLNSIISHASTDLEKTTGIKPKVIPEAGDAIGGCEYANSQVIVFDEAQFFADDLMIKTIQMMLAHKKRVICAGLDLDAFGMPFGSMPKLLAMADEVTKLRSICAVCQNDANRTFRTIQTEGQVVVGGAEAYEPRCLLCWEQGMIPHETT
jgi:thymidine kinase